MDEVRPGLLVSSLEAACSAALLRQHGVIGVVSLGCSSRPPQPSSLLSPSSSAREEDAERQAEDEAEVRMERLEFLDVQDAPETVIVGLFASIIQFVTKVQRRGDSSDNPGDSAPSAAGRNSILVHCVQGQSRSVAIVIMLLMTLHHLPLSAAAELVRRQRRTPPGISINPGFLAQLKAFELAGCDADSAVMWLLVSSGSSYPSSVLGKRSALDESGRDDESTIRCRRCRMALAGVNVDVIGNAIDTNAISTFVAEHVDDFWRHYVPIRAKKELKPECAGDIVAKGDELLLAPLPWMMSSLSSGQRGRGEEQSLRCPGCDATVGRCRRAGLNIIGMYNICSLVTLSQSSIILPPVGEKENE